MPVSQHFKAAYMKARKHQFDTYDRISSVFITLEDGRKVPVEPTGGGAAYGFHAYAAFVSAKRSIAFKDRLSEIVDEHERRSSAAKKGWITRRAA